MAVLLHLRWRWAMVARPVGVEEGGTSNVLVKNGEAAVGAWAGGHQAPDGHAGRAASNFSSMAGSIKHLPCNLATLAPAGAFSPGQQRLPRVFPATEGCLRSSAEPGAGVRRNIPVSREFCPK